MNRNINPFRKDRARAVPPVLAFLGVIASPIIADDYLYAMISDSFGDAGIASPPVPFDNTYYYEREMGAGLRRRFFELPSLIEPDAIIGIKTKALEIENLHSRNGCRLINIDPGYIDMFKVVLISEKYGGMKIYLSNGFYADVTLAYEDGRFRPEARAFPDFIDGRHSDFFVKLREQYKKYVRELRKTD
ncbi:MAG: DUF4416 family protein [Nitrospirae bacterium]|nr:DUF4416 family protein [Nitrospirota bacterium]